jgi:hypothetical protein
MTARKEREKALASCWAEKGWKFDPEDVTLLTDEQLNYYLRLWGAQ